MLVIQFAAVSATWLLFKLTFFDLIIIFIVDMLFLIVALITEKWMFGFMLRDIVEFYPSFTSQKIEKMDFKEKRHFIRLLLSFPKYRVFQTYTGSIIKVLPAFYLIVFLFDKSGGTLVEGVLKFWMVEILYVFLIFGSVVYTTASQEVFKIIDDLNSRYDLSEELKSLEIAHPKNDLFVVENVALFASSTALVILTSFAFDMELNTKSEFLITFGVIMIGGLLAIGRVYFLNRKTFLEALRTIFSRLADIEKGKTRAIPIHCDTTLANFEQTFNKLVTKLQVRDREIESWMARQAEQNKMARIGESISLITHDMVSPLHTVEFCLDEVLEENLEHDEVRDFLEQAQFNLRRINEMIEGVKFTLKNPRGRELDSSLFDAYSYTIQLLKTHFDSNDIDRIEFQFDSGLVSTKCHISHSNLVHLFYNTMKNSVDNLLGHGIEDPVVEIVKLQGDDEIVNFIIRDNGTGLSAADFKKMTAQDSLMDTRRGLGIRLTKRMIEKYDGDMFIQENERGFGTDMFVTLPRSL